MITIMRQVYIYLHQQQVENGKCGLILDTDRSRREQLITESTGKCLRSNNSSLYTPTPFSTIYPYDSDSAQKNEGQVSFALNLGFLCVANSNNFCLRTGTEDP